MTGQIRVNEITDETGTGAPEFPNGIRAATVTDEAGTGAPSFPFGAVGIEGVPTGAFMFFAMNTPPTGWLKANGAAISRTTYSALFDAIGTTFGSGNGSTTFNLPDLRGEFMRGWDDGRGVDSGRSFGTAQLDQMQSHNHAIGQASNSISNLNSAVRPANTFLGSVGNAIGGVLGARSGSETRPRNIALLACIKF